MNERIINNNNTKNITPTNRLGAKRILEMCLMNLQTRKTKLFYKYSMK